MHTDALIVNYGDAFLGHVFKLDRKIVCVVPSNPRDPEQAASAMRELVDAVGGDCGTCRSCPLGQSN